MNGLSRSNLKITTEYSRNTDFDAGSSVYLSVSHAFENKNVVDNWKKYGNSAFNSFSGRKLSLDGMVEHLIEKGKAITPAYLGTPNDYGVNLIPRAKQSFKGATMLGFDFDQNTSIDDLQNTRLFNEFSFLNHETASSTDEHKKTRAYIRLPYTVKSVKQYELITKSFHWHIKTNDGLIPDPKTADATHFFFGAKGANHVFKPELVISSDEMEAIIQGFKQSTTLERVKRSKKQSFYFGTNPLAIAGEKAMNRFLNSEPIAEGERNNELFSALYHAYIHNHQDLIPEIKQHAITTGLSVAETESTDTSAYKRMVTRTTTSTGTDGAKWSDAHIMQWRKLLTAVIRYNWTNAHSFAIALIATRMLARGKSEIKNDKTYIEISASLMQTVARMHNETYKKYVKEVVKSPYFESTRRKAKIGSLVLEINLDSFIDIEPSELTADYRTFYTLDELYNGSRSDLLVWVQLAVHGLDTSKAIADATGLSKKSVNQSMNRMIELGIVARTGEHTNIAYNLTGNHVERPEPVIEMVEVLPSPRPSSEPVQPKNFSSLEEPMVQDKSFHSRSSLVTQLPLPSAELNSEPIVKVSSQLERKAVDDFFKSLPPSAQEQEQVYILPPKNTGLDSKAITPKNTKAERKAERDKKRRKYYADMSPEQLEKKRKAQKEDKQWNMLYKLLENQQQVAH